ncbi:DUF4381 family protein [Rhodanobacter sp. DHB23]|uniref:DUF4381 family protein n=1 Tax=Rhodanobacter sp. DHB23 TaxID=2775923 RepID=UPI00177B87BB|nr:DUF4381 family protein [Rhodanobacter sp. DHB23]MBD8872811.1 DUF4381 family protein [Rhodanobacter sp. DHB23]
MTLPPPDGPVLRDIHLPPAPSWWPLAPGWWLLMALALLALVAAAWLWQRGRRSRRQRALLLDELEKLAVRHARAGDDAALAAALHQLLRRVARRHDAAATKQRGDDWRRTLARVPVAASVLDRLMQLEQAIYRPRAVFDVPATLAAARHWLQAAANPRAWRPPAMEQGHV